LLHVAALAVAAWQHQWLGHWFFALEAFLLLSLFLGLRLVNTVLKPLEFVRSFKDLLSEHEFAARFSQVGQAEMDQLIGTYNTMLRNLYEERLRLGDQRGFLEQFMQATPVGIVISDFDGAVSIANPAAAQFLGLPAASLAGKHFGQLKSRLAKQIAELATGEAQLVQKQGARRLRVQRQVFADRGFDREFVLIEELTAVLNESERAAYEKLIRLMSHEVNNTVASTNSLLESCLSYAGQVSAQDRDDFTHALRVVITRNEHLNRFMRDFAEVVKLPEPRPKPVDLAELLIQMQTIFQPQLDERHITWTSHCAADLPPVSVDRQQFEHVLINIFKNAMEAIGRDGGIEVRAQREAGRVLLQVIDDGEGLEDKLHEELFTPFYSSKASGQGLGLTLVKEILLRHGCEFDLHALADGRTCFYIRF
jgi:nitrogen fixation/metabolism regulation signal transduction histidine kinase